METLASLSIWERIMLKVGGRVFVGYEKREGWKGKLPVYLVKCPDHGVFKDYPHGFKPYFLCPKCFRADLFATAETAQTCMSRAVTR